MIPYPTSPSPYLPPTQESVGVTAVVSNCAQVAPVASTVTCAKSSWPLAQAPLGARSSVPSNCTSSTPDADAAQSSARKCVPLKPTQASTPTRSGRNPASKLRCTRITDAPLRVAGVICRSAASFTQAASTISPFFFSESVLVLVFFLPSPPSPYN